MTKRIKSKRERDPVTKQFLPYRNPDDVRSIETLQRLNENQAGTIESLRSSLASVREDECKAQAVVREVIAEVRSKETRISELLGFNDSLGAENTKLDELVAELSGEISLLKDLLAQAGEGWLFQLLRPGLALRMKCAIRGDANVLYIPGAIAPEVRPEDPPDSL